jgi:K+-transporting ATPase ATPase A chain
MAGRFALGRRVGAPLFRLAGVDAEQQQQGWVPDNPGLLVFNGLGVLAVYALQHLQVGLPLNPQDMAAVSPYNAFNTVVS